MKSIKSRLSPRQFLLLLSLCIGLASGLAANLLKWLIHSIEHLLTKGFIITQGNIMYLVYPCVGILLSALFIKFIVRDNIGHGVTKILYALSRNQGFIKGHNCWSSVVASAITIGCGGSVGAESPIVLTGSAIGSFFGRITGMDHRTLMILIGCGASGAVAGIFKAPIAGLVFTIEVLMIDLTMASLVPLRKLFYIGNEHHVRFQPYLFVLCGTGAGLRNARHPLRVDFALFYPGDEPL